MAAGLGFKDFVTGEVLTAADVDGYLMQGIWVFASAAARDAAVTSPQEGNACYLKDTNQVLTYSGSAWVAVGGGSPLTTKGDVYGFSTVDARIPIGANDTVLTADSTQALGLKWAAPASGSTFKGCSLYASPDTQSISNNTATALTFNLETFDTDGFHDNSTNTSRVTIPAGLAGKYLITSHVMYDLNATSGRFLNIYKNGSNVANGSDIIGSSSVYVANDISVVLSLAVSDYIEVFTRQTSGGALNAYKGAVYNALTVSYLGA